MDQTPIVKVTPGKRPYPGPGHDPNPGEFDNLVRDLERGRALVKAAELERQKAEEARIAAAEGEKAAELERQKADRCRPCFSASLTAFLSTFESRSPIELSM